MDATPCLEFRRVTPELVEPLARFFAGIVARGEDRHFHPHPFSPEEADKIARDAGRDLHCVFLEGGDILGYGLLRGWNVGYEVPSLGIIVAPEARRTGLSRLLMGLLHAAARRRGAPSVRLKVYPENLPAVRLYQSLGYRRIAEECGQTVMLLDLE